MNLEVIVDRLEQRGIAQAGKDLFINFIPQDIEGLLVRDYFGGTKVDHELPGYFRGRYMLIARTKDYESAVEMVRAAVAALTIRRPTDISGVRFCFMRPMGLPFLYAPTNGQSIEAAVNMEARYVDAPFPPE